MWCSTSSLWRPWDKSTWWWRFMETSMVTHALVLSLSTHKMQITFEKQIQVGPHIKRQHETHACLTKFKPTIRWASEVSKWVTRFSVYIRTTKNYKTCLSAFKNLFSCCWAKSFDRWCVEKCRHETKTMISIKSLIKKFAVIAQICWASHKGLRENTNLWRINGMLLWNFWTNICRACSIRFTLWSFGTLKCLRRARKFFVLNRKSRLRNFEFINRQNLVHDMTLLAVCSLINSE